VPCQVDRGTDAASRKLAIYFWKWTRQVRSRTDAGGFVFPISSWIPIPGNCSETGSRFGFNRSPYGFSRS
jgi:hypothetical protein